MRKKRCHFERAGGWKRAKGRGENLSNRQNVTAKRKLKGFSVAALSLPLLLPRNDMVLAKQNVISNERRGEERRGEEKTYKTYFKGVQGRM